jgi:hypothetical protein
MYIPLLLSAAIVEELELIWVCCWWRVDLFCFHVVADVSMVSIKLNVEFYFKNNCEKLLHLVGLL